MRRGRFFLLLAVLWILSLAAPAALSYEEALAQAETAFSSEGPVGPLCSESALGDLITDAMRESVGADFALLPSGLLAGELEAGAVFAGDLARVLPEDAPLVTAVVSLAELRAYLEHSVARMVTDSAERILTDESSWDGFLQTSGFSWEYDVTAPSGERVTRLLIRGEEMDTSSGETAFTLVSVGAVFDGRLGYPLRDAVPAGQSLRSCAEAYCLSRETLSRPSARVTVIGTSNYHLIDRMPIVAVAAACILIALFSSIPRLKEKARFSFEPGLRSYTSSKDRRKD